MDLHFLVMEKSWEINVEKEGAPCQEDKAHLLSQWDDAAEHANFLDLLHMPTWYYAAAIFCMVIKQGEGNFLQGRPHPQPWTKNFCDMIDNM